MQHIELQTLPTFSQGLGLGSVGFFPPLSSSGRNLTQIKDLALFFFFQIDGFSSLDLRSLLSTSHLKSFSGERKKLNVG